MMPIAAISTLPGAASFRQYFRSDSVKQISTVANSVNRTFHMGSDPSNPTHFTTDPSLNILFRWTCHARDADVHVHCPGGDLSLMAVFPRDPGSVGLRVRVHMARAPFGLRHVVLTSTARRTWPVSPPSHPRGRRERAPG